MTEYDPFAGAPADEAQAPYEPPAEAFEPPPAEPEPTPEPPKKAPAKKAAGTVKVDVKPNLLPFDSEGKVVLTFKGGRDFDAPWIVIHAKDLDDALSQVSGESAETLVELMKQTQKAGSFFAGQAPAKPQGSAAPAQQRQPAPQAAQEAPGGEERFCSHGKMNFRSGVAKGSGKPYKAFFCSSGDRNNECKAQFLR